MASTYSTSLKLQLIGNGDQSGVWGSTTNTNLNLVEQAVAGVVTITMLNADYTLSNLNGVSDESRNMVIVAGGTNSDIRKIVAPLVEKFYVVSNQTIGGYAITIGGSTGSYVTIPFGTTGQVYCDGTNFYSAQTTSAGDFTVNGNAYGQKGFDGTTVTAQGYGLRVRQSSGGNAAIVQFVNYVGNAQLGTIQHDGANMYINPDVGALKVPTVSSSDNSNTAASTAFVKTNIAALGTMATQNANNVSITGGTINGTPIGATTAATGSFTGLTSTGNQVLGAGAGSVRSFNASASGGEFSFQSSSTGIIWNFSDSTGSNGGNYGLYIRGLASNGAAGAYLTSFGVDALSSGFYGSLTYNNGVPVSPQPNNNSGDVGNWVSLPWYGGGIVTLPAGGTWAWWFSNRGDIQVGVNAGGTTVRYISPSNAFGMCWRVA